MKEKSQHQLTVEARKKAALRNNLQKRKASMRQLRNSDEETASIGPTLRDRSLTMPKMDDASIEKPEKI